MKQKFFPVIALLLLVSSVYGKTDKFGTWVEFEISKEFLKKWGVSFIPELRFQDQFLLDEYILEGKLGYQPWKFLEFAAAYRYNTEIKTKGNESMSSAVFDITGNAEFDRFEGSLRARLTNDPDGGDIPWETFYFRPRAKLVYNIKGNKITPFVCYELYLNLKQSDAFKQRFDIGFTRKLGKYQRIGLYYRLQDYFTEKNSINILGIDYRFKF